MDFDAREMDAAMEEHLAGLTAEQLDVMIAAVSVWLTVQSA